MKWNAFEVFYGLARQKWERIWSNKKVKHFQPSIILSARRNTNLLPPPQMTFVSKNIFCADVLFQPNADEPLEYKDYEGK